MGRYKQIYRRGIMAQKRKVMAVVTALSLAALIVTGTFAWTSLNSQITNEWRGGGTDIPGPGGTLHDDHVENGEDKAVYIENWGNEPLFVRIRLSEYMELGSGAGLKSVSNDSTGKPIPNPQNIARSITGTQGANLDDLDTWRKYNPYMNYPPEINMEFMNTYWAWEMGGQKYYYPAPVDRRVDKGYVDQNSPANLNENSVNSQGVKAKRTALAVITNMNNWHEDGAKVGNYWVLDSDGWAYWALPLMPDEATGLLLNKVRSIIPREESYYYGINVEAQMATKDGEVDSNGFKDNYERFGDKEQGGWTSEAEALMQILVNHNSGGSDNNIVHVEPVTFLEDGLTRITYSPALLNNVMYVKQGGSINLSGNGHTMSYSHYNTFLGNNNIAHTARQLSINIDMPTPVGAREELSGFSYPDGPGVDARRGPTITITVVVIPAESQGVVFGKSGKVYIDYGNNTYRELRDNGSLGSTIGVAEIE
jgi:hypothetical protein